MTDMNHETFWAELGRRGLSDIPELIEAERQTRTNRIAAAFREGAARAPGKRVLRQERMGLSLSVLSTKPCRVA